MLACARLVRRHASPRAAPAWQPGPFEVLLARGIRTRELEGNVLLAELQAGGSNPPAVLPYQLTAAQAAAAFRAWHARSPLSPGGLLEAASEPLRQALLPFWLFDATVSVRFTGLQGFQKERGQLDWRQADWQERPAQQCPWTHPCMQVYASYRHRRDLAGAALLPGMLARSRPLTQEEVQAQAVRAGREGGAVPVDAPDMRRAIAWQLALQCLEAREAAAAEARLRAEAGCTAVKDVQVQLRVRRRRSRLLLLPAFSLQYVYGEAFDSHGLRHPNRYSALIGGCTGAVAAERHFSPHKVQAAAAAAMGVLSSATAAAGLQGQPLQSAASLLAMLLVCTSVGLAARLAPLLVRQAAEERRLRGEEADLERVAQQGLGPQDVLDARHEALRKGTEWRRWAGASTWAWQAGKRRRWAEALLARQQERRQQRREFEISRARAEARAQREAEAEAARQARWGHGGHHSRRAAGGGQGFYAGGQGRRDFLGYYALLGLDAAGGSGPAGISQADVKRAFREAALRWHPDRLQSQDEGERRRAHDRFAKVKRAYEVLRSPERRRAYDSGVREPA